MKSAIQQAAFELGFDACRFTSADPPQTARRFEAWIAAGCHGTMGYLERTARQRVNPRLLLPEARSIIVLATSYHVREEAPASPGRAEKGPLRPTLGIFARYARFGDYHEIIGQRLQTLARFVISLGGPETQALGYVDSGPLLERDLGQRAGLGFIGKHTNLISRQLGNWFFLSEIVTTLPLDPDPPQKNHCGSCTRCLTACPTQAIRAPFQLDARRCISYLTIELKGPVPLELRRGIGHRIFGCDDCLAACPWNRFARQGHLLRGQLRPELASPDLVRLLSLDDAAFKQQFAHTPLWRAKRRGLLRNVCVALGNLGHRQALPALVQAASDPEPLIAEHARWAIEQIEGRTTPAAGFGREASHPLS